MQSNEQTVQEAMRLAQTEAGKQLIELLRRTDAKQLQRVVDSAAKGDLARAQQSLAQLLQDPQAQQLLGRLGK